jgi:NAD(P)-dependent dehydrogenase (short-subunit alcohol dehydrogenase family)
LIEREDLLGLAKLDGKVAVITCGAIGIGIEIARYFLKAGAKVVLVIYTRNYSANPKQTLM